MFDAEACSIPRSASDASDADTDVIVDRDNADRHPSEILCQPDPGVGNYPDNLRSGKRRLF